MQTNRYIFDRTSISSVSFTHVTLAASPFPWRVFYKAFPLIGVCSYVCLFVCLSFVFVMLIANRT
jgi:hypothetical protein